VEGAYLGECDYSIGFLSARRASTMVDPRVWGGLSPNFSRETRESCAKSGTGKGSSEF